MAAPAARPTDVNDDEEAEGAVAKATPETPMTEKIGYDVRAGPCGWSSCHAGVALAGCGARPDAAQARQAVGRAAAYRVGLGAHAVDGGGLRVPVCVRGGVLTRLTTFTLACMSVE